MTFAPGDQFSAPAPVTSMVEVFKNGIQSGCMAFCDDWPYPANDGDTGVWLINAQSQCSMTSAAGRWRHRVTPTSRRG